MTVITNTHQEPWLPNACSAVDPYFGDVSRLKHITSGLFPPLYTARVLHVYPKAESEYPCFTASVGTVSCLYDYFYDKS